MILTQSWSTEVVPPYTYVVGKQLEPEELNGPHLELMCSDNSKAIFRILSNDFGIKTSSHFYIRSENYLLIQSSKRYAPEGTDEALLEVFFKMPKNNLSALSRSICGLGGHLTYAFDNTAFFDIPKECSGAVHATRGSEWRVFYGRHKAIIFKESPNQFWQARRDGEHYDAFVSLKPEYGPHGGYKYDEAIEYTKKRLREKETEQLKAVFGSASESAPSSASPIKVDFEIKPMFVASDYVILEADMQNFELDANRPIPVAYPELGSARSDALREYVLGDAARTFKLYNEVQRSSQVFDLIDLLVKRPATMYQVRIPQHQIKSLRCHGIWAQVSKEGDYPLHLVDLQTGRDCFFLTNPE